MNPKSYQQPWLLFGIGLVYPVGDDIHLEGSGSVAKLCSTFYDPMDWSMPGLPVPHYLLELAEIHVHWVDDAIQPSHLPSSFLLLPSIFPNIKVFSNESVLPISEVAQSCPNICAPWTVAHQAPLPMEFSRQEHCSGVSFPTPRKLPDPGIELMSLRSPTLAGGFFTPSTTWEVHISEWQPS